MKKNYYVFLLASLVMGWLMSPLITHAQAIKDSLLKNYTQEDYLDFLEKERRGEIPYQGSTLSTRSAGDALVNNNAGADAISRFTQSETSLLVFGDNVVVGYNDAGSFSGGANKFTGWSWSSDGGATFTDGGTLPTNPVGDAGDPVLARDETSGRIYFTTLGFSSPRNIQVFRSDDNGVTWDTPVNGTPGGASEDKQWIVVDNFPGEGQGNVYLVSRRFSFPRGIFFFRSTDNGDTYGPNGGTLITDGFQGAYVAVGTDHSVYAFWWNATTIQMRKSTDFGVTFGPPITVASGLVGGLNGDMNLRGIRQGTATEAYFRSNSFPHAAVNPESGHIYVTYNSNPDGADKANIFMVMSTDGGATWSAPQQINDDGTTNDQWQPTIAVSPDGTKLGIFYYSREGDPNNNEFTYNGRTGYISGSSVVFTPGYVISDVMSLPEFGRDAVVNSSYMGDYNHAAATNTDFHVVWSDNRDDFAPGPPRKDPNVYYKSISSDLLSGPNISVSPLSIDFGYVSVNSSSTAEVTLFNIGDADLTVSGISLPGFDFVLTAPAVPMVIPSLGTVTLEVEFTPLSYGTQTSSIIITSDALNSPSVTVDLSGTGTVENDFCNAAIAVPMTCEGTTVSGSTANASLDEGLGTCGISITAPGVWYSVVGTGTLITASTCDQATYDTKISVFSGDCGTLNCIGGLDDFPGCSGFTTEYSWLSQLGVTYYILVHGFLSETGDFDLTLSTEGFLPVIDVEPEEIVFIVPLESKDSSLLTISNPGDCPIDLSWTISEREYSPSGPVTNQFLTPGAQVQVFGTSGTYGNYHYSINSETLLQLDSRGFFNDYPIRYQLAGMQDQLFADKSAFYEALKEAVGQENVDVVPEIMLHALLEMDNKTGTNQIVESGFESAATQLSMTKGQKPVLALDPKFRATMAMGGNVLYDNGPLVNSPGTGVGGADESVLQFSSLGLSILGFAHQYATGYRIADEFTITDPAGWLVDSLLFYSYQTGASTTSTITGVYFEIWDGIPNNPSSNVIFGDLTTNRLIRTEWSNIYRVEESTSGLSTLRGIMANTASAGLYLPMGTYYIVWQTDGSLFSGPWAPPITINGQTTTGNAGQYNPSSGTWSAVIDNGTGTPQGFPFLIYGETGDLCTWLTASPNIGITAGNSSTDVKVLADAAGLEIDTYSCLLNINSNAVNENPVMVPVIMYVGTPTERIDDLIAQVKDLKDAGVLNGGQANALIVKLEAAKNSLEAGNCHTAVNQLNAFINQVTDFIDEGILTAEQGNALIDDANVIIEILTPCDESKSGEVGSDILSAGNDGGYSLEQNRPNPFNGKTTISFSLATSNPTTLTVYNSIGQEVAVLFNEVAQANKSYTVDFDGNNHPKGVYFYHLKSGEQVDTMKKMILIK